MVDVSGKPVTDRVAVAVGAVRMTAETLALITEGRAKKGDVLSVARLAGIMGAKKTADLIPLCHPLPITKVALDLTPTRPSRRPDRGHGQDLGPDRGRDGGADRRLGRGCLTVYDMVKAAEKSMGSTASG
jgi:cyclic pyranopterin monophosphate synthase